MSRAQGTLAAKKTSGDRMRAGEWPVPCPSDPDPLGSAERWDNARCNNCWAAGGGNSTPYCASKLYRTMVKEKKEVRS